MLILFTQHMQVLKPWLWGNRPFCMWGRGRGPCSGANASPVQGIKKCLAGTFKKTRNEMPVISLFVNDIAFCPTILIIVAWGND